MATSHKYVPLYRQKIIQINKEPVAKLFCNRLSYYAVLFLGRRHAVYIFPFAGVISGLDAGIVVFFLTDHIEPILQAALFALEEQLRMLSVRPAAVGYAFRQDQLLNVSSIFALIYQKTRLLFQTMCL